MMCTVSERVPAALQVPTDEDYVGSLGTCSSGCLEFDSGFAADHDDSLPEEPGFAEGRRDCGCGVMVSPAVAVEDGHSSSG